MRHSHSTGVRRLERIIMRKRLAVALVAVVLAAGCKGPVDPSQNKTETFTGTVQPVNIGVAHPFDIQNLGEITVSLTALTPGNVAAGIAYGQPQGAACFPIQQNAVGTSSIGRTALSGQILLKGTYCVVVFDPSGILLNIAPWTVAQNYTV